MSALTASKPGIASHWAALLLAILFVAMQAPTLGYGTRINDLPHIRDYQVPANVTHQSGLERNTLIGTQTDRTESLDLWMVRFKLYTVDADEVYAIIALARMQPAQLQFDPRYYQYGGVFLYPLGAYYFALSKLHVLSLGSLEQMLAHPDQIDRVWIAGRALILVVVMLAGLALYLAIAEFAPRAIAVAGLAVFYFCPATIMFSQVLKPHWYALLFTNIALLILARAFAQRRLSGASEIALGIVLGLAVGSVVTFGLFAVLVWGALLYLVWQRAAPLRALLSVPIVAVAAFLATNPYYVLSWHAVQTERAAQTDWFMPALHLDTVPELFRVSILPGFGVVLTVVFLAVLVRHLLRPAPWGLRLFGLAIFLPLVVMAALTASHSYWHANFRYFPYVLPLMIAFLAAAEWPYRKTVLMLTAAATILQSVPMKLAYVDENSDVHSTRLASAAWIDSHVPADDAICASTKTLAPYSVPPFGFDRHKINTADCRWLVVLDGNQDPKPPGPDWTLAQKFGPRLSPPLFPLVWEHINPQVAIYRKAG